MPLTITPPSAQVGIGSNESVTLTASGGSDSYIWLVPTNGNVCPVTPPPPEEPSRTYTLTGNAFGLVTVIVTDTNYPNLMATAIISVGSVTIAGPDGNYYRCYPSGATEQLSSQDASTLFESLGKDNVFGDANTGEIKNVSSLGTKSISIEPGTTAVTCYLLNLAIVPLNPK